jgi:hypothetical protein
MKCQSILAYHEQRMAQRLPSLTKETVILLGLILVFFLIPYLPKGFLLLLDNMFIRIGVIVGLLALVHISPLASIAGFLVVALLFIERNRVKIQSVRRVMEQVSEPSAAIEEIVTPPTAPPQPEFEIPVQNEMDFFPKEDSGDNTFTPVDESQDTKQPLPTETADGSDKAIVQLFQWVDPKQVQAP